MKCLLVSVCLLVLISVGHALDCKVCEEGLQNDVTEYPDSFLNDPCQDEEEDNMETCSPEEDVCVKYQGIYKLDIGTDQLKKVEMSYYKCGIEAKVDHDEEESPFCMEWVEKQPSIYQEVSCKVVEISGKEAHPDESKADESKADESKDCRNEMCSAGQVPQLFLGAASIVIFFLF